MCGTRKGRGGRGFTDLLMIALRYSRTGVFKCLSLGSSYQRFPPQSPNHAACCKRPDIRLEFSSMV